MGRKLDALLGRRRFKSSEFKATVSLAVSRLGVLKNQRQARCSIARSDVVQLLNTNNHQRAILRVEQVIKEQNMVDVFDILDAYCHLLIDRVHLFEQEKVCPEELIEAVSSLIYASTRCGEFPELQELRVIFSSLYGKEFAARAIELRNHCGVNPKVIQKLSTRTPSLENKKMVLKQIASDNNIHLPMEEEEDESLPVEDWRASTPRGERNESIDGADESMERGSGRRRTKYKDVADAAQAAFESAAYAAAAARAAVELSRSESADSPRVNVTQQPKFNDDDEHIETELKFEKNKPLQKYDDKEVKRTLSSSSSDSSDDYVTGGAADSAANIKEGNVRFDESDDGEGSNRGEIKEEEVTQGVEPLNINRRPISVRSRWAQRR